MADWDSLPYHERRTVKRFEPSAFGYWIRPDGTVIPMAELQAHGKWLLENGVFAGPYEFLSDAAQEAVSAGWVSVSISPVGTSCSVRARRGVVSASAVSALRAVLQIAEFYDGEVHLEDFVGTGRAACTRLGMACWDDRVWGTVAGGALARARSLLVTRRNVERVRRERAAVESGWNPDLERFDAAVDRCRASVTGLKSAAYGWEQSEDMDRLRRIMYAAMSSIHAQCEAASAALDEARAAVHGIEPDDLSDIEQAARVLIGDRSPQDALESLVRDVDEAIAGTKLLTPAADIVPEPAREPVKNVLAGLRLRKVRASTILNNLRRLDVESVSAETPARLSNLMGYYLSHECGRDGLQMTRECDYSWVSKAKRELREAFVRTVAPPAPGS